MEVIDTFYQVLPKPPFIDSNAAWKTKILLKHCICEVVTQVTPSNATFRVSRNFHGTRIL